MLTNVLIFTLLNITITKITIKLKFVLINVFFMFMKMILIRDIVLNLVILDITQIKIEWYVQSVELIIVHLAQQNMMFVILV